jgi:hypothetical protein
MYKSYVSYYNMGLAQHYQTLHLQALFVYHQLSLSDTCNSFVIRHNVMYRVCVKPSTGGFESYLLKDSNVSIIKHLPVCIRVLSPVQFTTLFTLCFYFCVRAKEQMK